MNVTALLQGIGAITVPVAAYFAARHATRAQQPVVNAGATKTVAETDGVIVTTTTDLIETQQLVVDSVQKDYERVSTDLAALRADFTAERIDHATKVGELKTELATATAHAVTCEAQLFKANEELGDLRERVAVLEARNEGEGR